jgi:hypothetical protein
MWLKYHSWILAGLYFWYWVVRGDRLVADVVLRFYVAACHDGFPDAVANLRHLTTAESALFICTLGTTGCYETDAW